MWICSWHTALLCLGYEVINEIVRSAKLPDFLLHGGFEEGFLGVDKGPFLLVVGNAVLVTPGCSSPPIPPGKTASSVSIGSLVTALFTGGCSVGACAEG